MSVAVRSHYELICYSGTITSIWFPKKIHLWSSVELKLQAHKNQDRHSMTDHVRKLSQNVKRYRLVDFFLMYFFLGPLNPEIYVFALVSPV